MQKTPFFDVILKEIGFQKVFVSKIIREYTNLGFKEAKKLVESAPIVVKKSIAFKEAEKIGKNYEQRIVSF